jgi:CO/xanthine dehydrogenase Mo-binding subunit
MTGAGTAIYWNKMPHSGVQLKLDRSGGVTVFCGSSDIGQGSDSILAYIVAEVLGIEPVDIRVVTSDTDLTPVDLGSYSSRVTLMTGNAAIEAAGRAREYLTQAVSEKLEVPAERLVFARRRVFDVEDPEKGMTFPEAVWLAEAKFGTLGTTGSYTPPNPPGKFKGSTMGPSPAYSYCAAVAEVEVDPDTGIVVVPRIWIAHDGGQSIHGTGRSPHGRDDLSRQSQRGSQVPVIPGVQESDHAGDVRRHHLPARRAGAGRAVRGEGGRPGAAAAGAARHSQRHL